jgi:hypothetical protein
LDDALWEGPLLRADVLSLELEVGRREDAAAWEGRTESMGSGFWSNVFRAESSVESREQSLAAK